jgi:Zn-dependent oligopeptidase
MQIYFIKEKGQVMSNLGNVLSSMSKLNQALLLGEEEKVTFMRSEVVSRVEPGLDNSLGVVSKAFADLEEQVSQVQSMFDVREEETDLQTLISQTTLGVSYTNLVQKYDAQKFGDLVVDGQKISERFSEEKRTDLLALFNKRVNRNRSAYLAAPDLRETFDAYQKSKEGFQGHDPEVLRKLVAEMKDVFDLSGEKLQAAQIKRRSKLMSEKAASDREFMFNPGASESFASLGNRIVSGMSIDAQIKRDEEATADQNAKNKPINNFAVSAERLVALNDKVEAFNVPQILAQFDSETEAEMNKD